jgi:hypothetical protein
MKARCGVGRYLFVRFPSRRLKIDPVNCREGHTPLRNAITMRPVRAIQKGEATPRPQDHVKKALAALKEAKRKFDELYRQVIGRRVGAAERTPV